MGGILVKISHEMLKNQAELTGFRTDILEKVGLLIHLLGLKPWETDSNAFAILHSHWNS